MIRESPVLRSELEGVLPAMRDAAMAPASQAQIRNIVGKRFATYPQPERDDGEWMAWWEDYYAALEGLRPERIEAAMVAWTRTPERFLPKGGQLRSLALKTTCESVWGRAIRRAHDALSEPTPRCAPLPKADTKDDKEEIKRGMAELSNYLKGKAAQSISARTRNRRVGA